MKIIYTLLILFISNSLFAQQYYQVTTDVLNVRNSADKNSEIISKLNLGDSIYVAEYSDDWSKVRLASGNEGYVSSKYISKDYKYSEENKKDDKTSPWLFYTVFALIILIGVFKGSAKVNSNSRPNKSANNSSNKIITKPKQLFWYMCKNCGKTVRQSSTPNYVGCQSNHKFHEWTKLAEVGETNYQCRNCGTDINAKSTPSYVGCPTEKKMHQWTKL